MTKLDCYKNRPTHTVMIRIIDTLSFVRQLFVSIIHSIMGISSDILVRFKFMNVSIIEYTSIGKSANEFEYTGKM